MATPNKGSTAATPAQTSHPSPTAHHALPEELHALLDWWRRHGNRFSILVLVVAALFFGYRFFQRHRTQARASAAVEFTQARTLTQLEDLVGAHGRTPAGISARLKLAKAYFDAGRYPMALETYEAFLEEHPDHPLVDTARVGVAHTLEAMRRTSEALEAFTRFADDHPGHFLLPQVMLGKARCLAQLDRLEEARAQLDAVEAAYPDSLWAFTADNLRPNLQMLARPPRRPMFDRMQLSPTPDAPPTAFPPEADVPEAQVPQPFAPPVEPAEPPEAPPEATPLTEVTPMDAPQAIDPVDPPPEALPTDPADPPETVDAEDADRPGH